MRKILFAKLLFGFLLFSCSKENVIPFDHIDVVTHWADMSNFITKNTFGNTPTFASRSFGYLGLTMYETTVHSSVKYQSLAGQLNGLEKLPLPDLKKEHNWLIALNAGQSSILKSIYNQTSDKNKQRIDSLEAEILKNILAQGVKKSVAKRSIHYGKSVAEAIFEWSKSDGGHRGYLQNFDKDQIFPEFPGSWKPPLYAQSFSHHPLHPHWGKNRTFSITNSGLPLPYMIPYSEDENSEYYKQFRAVYEQDKILTQEDKEVAIWWGDDPDETFTPPGHSYYIANKAISHFKPDLTTCSAVYASVGMAVADAFINCWKWKYHFFSERPNTYIPKFIDEEWESFWPDPPFPAFPSGHAIQAAAAATVLASFFGDSYSFTDDAHVGRERDELRDVDFKARQFNSFWDVADETAKSRFLGGIHTPQDNEVGLDQGVLIAKNIINLNWKNENSDG